MDENENTPVLTIARDALVYDGFIVGQVRDGTLSVNLGWARLAGLKVRIEADPTVDRHRNGVVLERPAAG
jgi:hypothetical protein